jgi:hypothetical protein
MIIARELLKTILPVVKRLRKSANQEDGWTIDYWIRDAEEVITPRVKKYPSKKAQEAYPLDKFPCRRCEHEHLPFWDPQGYGHWEHQYEGSGRGGCPRFGTDDSFSNRPRPGTLDGMEEWSVEVDHEILQHKYNLLRRENYELRRQLKESKKP